MYRLMHIGRGQSNTEMCIDFGKYNFIHEWVVSMIDIKSITQKQIQLVEKFGIFDLRTRPSIEWLKLQYTTNIQFRSNEKKKNQKTKPITRIPCRASANEF